MSYNFISRVHLSPGSNESARKKARLDEQPAGDFADDDFADGEFTAEEFDFCLTQAAEATSAQPHTSNANAVPINQETGKNIQYSMGQMQLLGRKVASLTKELHLERLSKREELKAQADLHSKEIKLLKSQLEFKEGELHSVVSRQTSLEKKLLCRGVETRKTEVANAATSTTYNDFPGSVKAQGTQPINVVLPAACCNLPKGATWLGHQHALYPVRSITSIPTHLDVIRECVNKGRRGGESADAVALSLQCLSDATIEAAIEAFPAGLGVPVEKLVLSSTAHAETFVFDTLAKLAQSSDSREASLSVVALQRLAESSTAQPILEALNKLEYMSHKECGAKIRKETAIPLIRLVKAALDTPDSLTPMCCPIQVRDTCLWNMLSALFESEEVGIDLLHEGALLVQQASRYEQACWICFDHFVGELMEQFENKLEKSKGEVRHENLLLGCFCVVAQTRTQYRHQTCRLASLCNSQAEEIEKIWYTEEDGIHAYASTASE